MNVPLDKKFAVLCEIVRAQHFAWREAVCAVAPDVDVEELVRRMWEITGVKTAEAYLKRIDAKKPLPLQIARSIAWSSVCMGEHAEAEEGEGLEAFVRHTDCPWHQWHKKNGVVPEDRMGCDAWFFSTVAEIGKALGVNVRVETNCTLPDGDDCCLRRIWTE